MLSSSIPTGCGTVLIRILLKGKQGKGKNCKIKQEFCLWGARTQLAVGAGILVKGKAASCWTYSSTHQMVKPLKCMYRLTATTPECYRCIHCLGIALHSDTLAAALHRQCYCSWTAPPQPVAPLSHAMCRMKAPQVTEKEGKPTEGAYKGLGHEMEYKKRGKLH